MAKTFLLCGGAGYVGSHMAKLLTKLGHSVVVFDNLSTGHSKFTKFGEFFYGDLLNNKDIKEAFKTRKFDAVMHFSAKTVVPESVKDPAKYFENNVIGTLNLLKQVLKNGVDKFIFSSTAGIYGEPESVPIVEGSTLRPINPYGESKLVIENILKYYYTAYGLRSVSFRYFNAAGADPDAEIGESHDPETHLIPNIINSILEKKSTLKIFGNDYNTKDGFCVRDYVHVNDIAEAHLLGSELIENEAGAFTFNLGSGQGYSVMEIISKIEKFVGKKIDYKITNRRQGDAEVLIADIKKAKEVLKWTPKQSDLDIIVSSAVKWHKKLLEEKM